MRVLRAALVVGLLSLLVVSMPAQGQVPQLINYQGILNDPNTGAPISGSRSMTFSIYSVPSGGTALWSETQTVSVNNGYFSVLLGSTTPIPYSVFSGDERYLGVKVGTDPEMTPRKRIVSVGYAVMSTNADMVDGKHANEIAIAAHDHWGEEWSGNGVGLSLSSNNDYGLYAYGSGYPAIYAESGGYQLPRPSGNIGVYGYATDTGVFGWGTNFGAGGRSTNGVGVKGISTNGDGVVGETSAWGKSGVYGHSTNGIGVTGRSDNDNGVVGWTGTSDKSGVYGHSTDGFGVTGRSTNNYGVQGFNSNSGNYGYLGGSDHAVYGKVSSSYYGATYEAYGVLGYTYSDTTHFGVYGYSDSGLGVYGKGSTGNYGGLGGWAGVYGYGSNFAGYFAGNVFVWGTLSKGGGGFKIDHPLDPANKYLYHSFVESPDMMNVYNGNITLDANGEAWVELPEWFEVLNKDFRYQLTAIGAPAPNLYVAEEISGNRFRIAGGTPGMKVSWQVTGIRQDAFANAHRIQVEVEKSGKEQGKYLHPKEHGMPETMGIDYEKTRMMKDRMR